MAYPCRVVVLALSSLAVAALSACGAGPRAPAVACSGDEQCGGAAWCVDGACVGNSPPRASFTVPAGVGADALVPLDGSGSSDPDERDQIVSWVWTVEATSAPCAPPVVADATALASVRFGCAGTFAVHLVVIDSRGVESPVETREVSVAESGAGTVRAGDDQVVQHTCTGTPLKCQLASPVKLAGSTTATGAALAYAWTVSPPPNRPLGAARRVRFTPSASVDDPAVEVETDGVAISGDWVLHLEVRDGTTLVGADDLRLSVGNRPPVVVPAASTPYPHRHDAAAGTYGASGTVALQVSDPDGDPVTRQAEWRHTGDGGGRFDGRDDGTALTFTIAVTDPAWLIGMADRTIVVAADDGNGGTASRSIPVVVGNRPPVLSSSRSPSVGHVFRPDTMTFETSVPVDVASWVDPDGDPLTGAGTGDPRCAATLRPDGTETVSCAATYGGLDTLALFVGTRPLVVRASDPWEAGTGEAALTISNRPPTVGGSSYDAPMTCSQGAARSLCCRAASGTCLVYGNVYGGGTFAVPLAASDPDGDPVQISATANAAALAVTCGSSGCAGLLTVPPVSACTTPDALSISVRASDGVALTAGAVSVATSCR